MAWNKSHSRSPSSNGLLPVGWGVNSSRVTQVSGFRRPSLLFVASDLRDGSCLCWHRVGRTPRQNGGPGTPQTSRVTWVRHWTVLRHPDKSTEEKVKGWVSWIRKSKDKEEGTDWEEIGTEEDVSAGSPWDPSHSPGRVQEWWRVVVPRRGGLTWDTRP